MNQDHLCRLNIANLTSFWKLFGFDTIKLKNGNNIYASVDWPNRVWLDYRQEQSSEAIEVLLDKSSRSTQGIIIPVWNNSNSDFGIALERIGFNVLFRQVAMILRLKEPFKNVPDALTCRKVQTDKEADIWTNIASSSFGYAIPTESIHKVIHKDKIRLFLAFLDEAPVASGLLYDSDNVVGIHMVGTLPTYRCRGIARTLMTSLLNDALTSGATHATLQASDLGLPLYENLGFEKQFVITNHSNLQKYSFNRQ